MKRLLALSLMIVALAGCDTYNDPSRYDIACLDGVQYYVRTHGYKGYMSPRMKPDGTVHTCTNYR